MEINPLVTTKDGKLLALDCKIDFDDNAMFRHKDLKELRGRGGGRPARGCGEQGFSLNYIKLDGSIACMVNGAGLAMATMDIIHVCGRIAGELSGCGRRREPAAD